MTLILALTYMKQQENRNLLQYVLPSLSYNGPIITQEDKNMTGLEGGGDHLPPTLNQQ